MTQNELREVISFGHKVAIEAGRILKKGIDKKFKVIYKSRIDPVTEYDLKANRLIVGRIKRRFPEHSILSEEGKKDNKKLRYCWVIDPLDGTVNYTHGFPVYSVSIALQENGNGILGVVYDPERDELFSAGYKLGAFMNGKKISVSSESRLSRSLLSTGFGYNVRTARLNNLGFFARMVKTAQAVRRAGSAALDLSWVACGRLDGLWEYYLHPWDSAAGMIIVEEAGGIVSRIDGKMYSIFHNNILASNGRIHKQIQAVLTATKKH